MRILLAILISAFSFSCSTSKATKTSEVLVEPPRVANPIQGPKMVWDKTMVDFGKVKKGEKRHATYEFQNVGNESLIIDIATSCHCTTLEYPQGVEIAPGRAGTFKVTFDSAEKEKSGVQDITIVLKNEDKNGYPIIEELFFKYELID